MSILQSYGKMDAMLTLRFRSPPALGAALIILSLFVDPFFQQVIALGERQTSDHNNAVQIPRAVRYSKGLSMSNIGRSTDSGGVLTDFSMQAAIRSGLASPDAKVIVGARCPSTTCLWENYTTLAVCSKCFDITKNLTKETVNYKRHLSQVVQLRGNGEGVSLMSGPVVFNYLPNGLYMERVQDDQVTGFNEHDTELRLVISSTYNASDTVSFRTQPNLLWSFAMIRNTSEASFTASECGVSLCMKEITSKSVKGVLEEQASEIDVLILQDSLLPPANSDSNITDPQQGHFVTTDLYPRQDLIFEGNFSIPQISINSIGRELHSLFFEDVTSEKYVQDPDGSNNTFRGKIPRRLPTGYYVIGRSGVKYQPSTMQVLNSVTDLPNLFDNLAASITNNLRLNDERATIEHGTSAIVVYRIRWVYIILPAVSTLGGSIFLLLSVVYTRRLSAPLWKSSAVAMLKCGATLKGFARDQNRGSELDKLAELTSFELVRPGDKAGSSTTGFDRNTRYSPIISRQCSR
ncbi:hypothetical protein P171DRAFT_432901 [Karstenula rhodostoma CBS 690.94]|uniref:Uncharacterized protein n=1 Tax=Karstenula rhodostoma CBS 690.94 TaxID=1392251 RepID=A0A9P4PGQ8_9PLEO|nr:hypothetical protein P171DRAFT_432901 [Karstenula rhodostoma CBS 690.94]